jgi:hypothetical protein
MPSHTLSEVFIVLSPRIGLASVYNYRAHYAVIPVQLGINAVRQRYREVEAAIL